MSGITAIISRYNHPTVEGRKKHLSYARAAAYDCLDRGESPVAIHLVLGDANQDESPEVRTQALRASEDILRIAERAAVYSDFGISEGMEYEIRIAGYLGKSIEYRTLPDYQGIDIL